VASLFRPTYVRTDPDTGRKVRKRVRKWYIKYRDADGRICKVPGFKDKEATKALARELELKADRKQAHLADPFEEHHKRPLAEHLADFYRALLAKGNTDKQARQVRNRVRTILDGCGFRFIADLSASRVQSFLADLRNTNKAPALLVQGKEWYTKAELAAALGVKPASITPLVRRHRLAAIGTGKARRFPRSTAETLRGRLCRGISIQTANFYLGASKQFCRWLVKDRRTNDNALAHLEGGNVKLDRRHDRQTLPPEHLTLILQTARGSDWTFRGLTGLDRHFLYLAAMTTGFRASELASLSPSSFDLDADPPTATVASTYTKNKQPATQPLPPETATALRDFLANKPASARLWPGNWADDAAEMLSRDLADCGLPYVIDGPDGPLFADFHSLRHSFVALLERSGASLKQAMQLARHSDPKLTMARYGRARLTDLGTTLERMPTLLPGIGPTGISARATGTDGKPALHSPLLSPGLGYAPDLGGERLSLVDNGSPLLRDDATPYPKRRLLAVGNACERLNELPPAGFGPATYGLGKRPSRILTPRPAKT